MTNYDRIDLTVNGFYFQIFFLLLLQTNSAVATTTGFQTGSPNGGRGPGANPGDLQTMGLLLFHFVTDDGSKCKKLRGHNPVTFIFSSLLPS